MSANMKITSGMLIVSFDKYKLDAAADRLHRWALDVIFIQKWDLWGD